MNNKTSLISSFRIRKSEFIMCVAPLVADLKGYFGQKIVIGGYHGTKTSHGLPARVRRVGEHGVCIIRSTIVAR